ncbi:hypothetical protein GCM10023116_48110 [Kistimonas scapharcae]|uniref:Tetratricopeptide repeat protein n=2 Tax=Kistimonas scapharcae TaxID=1036133 RepID=A0ABP8V9E5_9GAMM
MKGEGEYYLGNYQNASASFEKSLEVTLNDPAIWAGENGKRFISETSAFMHHCRKKLNLKSKGEEKGARS